MQVQMKVGPLGRPFLLHPLHPLLDITYLAQGNDLQYDDCDGDEGDQKDQEKTH